MTSPNTGVRRTAAALVALGAALGLSACSAGQAAQTSAMAPAVDGGRGQAGDISVNNVRVVLPESEPGQSGQAGQAKVEFAASYAGDGLTNAKGVNLQSVKVGGQSASVSAPDQLARGCSLVLTAEEKAPAPSSGCLHTGTASLGSSDQLKIGQNAPVEVMFTDGTTIHTVAAIVAAPVKAGDQAAAARDAEGTGGADPAGHEGGSHEGGAATAGEGHGGH